MNPPSCEFLCVSSVFSERQAREDEDRCMSNQVIRVEGVRWRRATRVAHSSEKTLLAQQKL